MVTPVKAYISRVSIRDHATGPHIDSLANPSSSFFLRDTFLGGI
jgi:hypothetical protein